jgi:spore coat polysaccharide biosynthesis protein SpsF (cytidylyltransferase family)
MMPIAPNAIKQRMVSERLRKKVVQLHQYKRMFPGTVDAAQRRSLKDVIDTLQSEIDDGISTLKRLKSNSSTVKRSQAKRMAKIASTSTTSIQHRAPPISNDPSEQLHHVLKK